ncbi:hypothetical protein Pfo_001870 [Paulownia fortunei]|nr:hypothetical protein Pfo_001870 [Paulownia fortunei]
MPFHMLILEIMIIVLLSELMWFSWVIILFLGVLRNNLLLLKILLKREYHVVVSTVGELLWLHSLLTELGVVTSSTPPIYCDNMVMIFLCANLMFCSHMKHIVVDFYFVHQHV